MHVVERRISSRGIDASRRDVRLSVLPMSPCTNQPKALDDWLATGLMIQWKSGVFSSRRYLQLIPDEERASFLRRDESSWKQNGGVAQFQLFNAYNGDKRAEIIAGPQGEHRAEEIEQRGKLAIS